MSLGTKHILIAWSFMARPSVVFIVESGCVWSMVTMSGPITVKHARHCPRESGLWLFQTWVKSLRGSGLIHHSVTCARIPLLKAPQKNFTHSQPHNLNMCGSSQLRLGSLFDYLNKNKTIDPHIHFSLKSQLHPFPFIDDTNNLFEND